MNVIKRYTIAQRNNAVNLAAHITITQTVHPKRGPLFIVKHAIPLKDVILTRKHLT